MRKIVLLLAVVFFLPSLCYADGAACDIGVYVYDDVDSTALDSILVACYSYEDEVYVYKKTNVNGLALFPVHNWPDPGGCDQNYGDYMLCLPWFWEQEDVYFEYEGECSQQTGCTVEFYIDESDKKLTVKCTLPEE